MAIDYSDHGKVIEVVGTDQAAEEDNRNRVREAIAFVNTPEGQWERDVANQLNERPQYTLDLVGKLKDQIVNEANNADFGIRVRAAGGDATEEIAETYDGLIRNIENVSNASRIFSAATDDLVTGGLAGWEVVQDYVESDSFDQDLIIKPIQDFVNRVWFDSSAQMSDMSDAAHVVIYTDMSEYDYKQTFKDGKAQSLTVQGKYTRTTSNKDTITVGRILFKKPKTIEIVQMTNGAVYVKDDKFTKVADDLAAKGVTEKRTRTRKSYVVCSRMFDAGGWLNEEAETVFKTLPVVPCYGHFKIINGQITYRGFIERLMDLQRSFNYIKSREIEQAAFSPRIVYWMTAAMAAGHVGSYNTMNTDSDPVKLFNPDPDMPGYTPQMNGGNAVDPGLMAQSSSLAALINESAGLFGLSQGQADGVMSGVAIQSLQNKGDNSTAHWFDALEEAKQITGKIIVEAAPKVYDAQRQVRVLGVDGKEDVVTLNERVRDEQTGEVVDLNDLSQGTYDVICEVGAKFRNQQQETVKAIESLGQIVPGLIEANADILLGNIPAPGMDLAADRYRQQLLMSGAIPEDQLTDEEKEQMMAAQQQPQEATPEQKIADAEIGRVEAETADVISKTQERQHKGELAEFKLMLQQQEQERKAQQDELNAMVKGMQATAEAIQTGAETIETLKSIIGAEGIVTPDLLAAAQNQTEIVREQQEQID